MRSGVLLTTAIDRDTGGPWRDPIPEAEAVRDLKRLLERAPLRSGDALRGLQGGRRAADNLDDPRSAGWTFVVGAEDPFRVPIAKAIAPLAEHRRMANPTRPLLYGGEDLWAWIDDYDRQRPTPHYVLLAGEPKFLPFELQSLLGTIASVGRLSFDNVDDYEAYVQKVLRLEMAPESTVASRAVIFAPNAGSGDATSYSESLMAQPIAAHARAEEGLDVRFLSGEQATKAALLTAMADLQPALIYTAGHGVAPPRAPLCVQRRIAGAVCCQPIRGGELGEWIFQASDVPRDRPFAEGAVVFQFACFGAGVPAQSEAGSWLAGSRVTLATEDFVSALPMQLLAHPRGPIGFVGHVDEAFVLAFVDPADDEGDTTSKTRLGPFTDAVEALLSRRPTGRSLASLSRQFTIGNDRLAAELVKTRHGFADTPERLRRLLTTFLRRTDAKNYIVLGDPGARIRGPE